MKKKDKKTSVWDKEEQRQAARLLLFLLFFSI
jgi:hypothetical protein